MKDIIYFFESYWTVLISIFAFVVSFLTLYYTHWQKFKLEIFSDGRFALGILNNDQPIQYQLYLTLNFSNAGARVGIFENVYLEFANSNNEKILLVPRHEFLSQNVNIEEHEYKAPGSFLIGNRETISKKISFVPREKDIEFKPNPGEYKITICAKGSEDDVWKKYGVTKISLKEHALEIIESRKDFYGLTTEIEKEYGRKINELKNDISL